MSGQVKRKAVEQATQQTNKKQKNNVDHNTATNAGPQFLNFDNDDTELLLQRGPIDKFQPHLFEQQTKVSRQNLRQENQDDLFSSKKTIDSSDSGESDDENPDQMAQQLKKSKHDHTASQLKKNKAQLDSDPSGMSAVKTALHLTAKSVQVGQIFLATVANITPFELKVTLPDGVSGSISYREISDTLTAQIDAKLETHMNDPSSVNINELRDLDILSEIPTLDELFVIGQQITPMVIKVVQKPYSVTMKQKIFCSLRPSVVNAQYAQNLSLLPACGIPLMGDIESVQAKGYVVQYGLGFKGFVSFSERVTATSFPQGALVTTLLPKNHQITTEERTVQVSMDTQKILHHIISADADVSMEQIRPGQFFNASVSKHLKDGGLVVQILGNLYASISALHLPPLATQTQYPLLSKVVVRIMAVQSNRTGETQISATLHQDLTAPSSLYRPNHDFTTVAQLGDIKQAKVIKVINKALLVQFLHDSAGAPIPANYYTHTANSSTPPTLGWLPLRSCADVALTDFPKQFKANATITVRVVGFNYLDCLVQLTAKPSLLQAQAMAYSDILPGELYNGIVIKTLPAKDNKNDKKDDKVQANGKKQKSTTINNGVILQISPSITAFIPLSQLTNQGAPSNPALVTKKFALGSKHQCRVLVSEPEEKKLIATAKPALLEKHGQDEVFGSYAHAKDIFSLYQSRQKPLLLGGYVDRCAPNFVAVRFFNNIVGVVTKSMLVQQGIITETQEPQFTVGEYLLTRVLNVYDDKLSLSLAINVSKQDQIDQVKLSSVPKTTPTGKQIATPKTPFEISTRVGALINDLRIVGTDKNGLTCKFSIADQDYDAFLPSTQLSDVLQHQEQILKKLAKVETVPVAMVTGVESDVIQVSIKMSNFVMYSTLLPTSEIPALFNITAKSPKADQNLLTFLSKLAKNFSTVTSVNTTTVQSLPIPFPQTSAGPYIGTVEEIVNEHTVKVSVSSKFNAFIHNTKLIDGYSRESQTPLDLASVVTVGQSIAFSKATTSGTTDVTQYQAKTSEILKIFKSDEQEHSISGAAFLQRWATYLKSVKAYEQFYLQIDQTPDTPKYPAGFELGTTLTNAKVAQFDTSGVTFNTPAATKSKIVIKCANVDFHAPEITEATVGSTMDLVVVGYGPDSVAAEGKKRGKAEVSNVVFVSALPKYKTATTKVTFDSATIGHVLPANVVYIGSSVVVSLPTLQNSLLTLSNTLSSVDLFRSNMKVGSTISVLVVSQDTICFVAYGKPAVGFAMAQGATQVTLVKKAYPVTKFAPQTLFDSSITSTEDLTVDNNIKVTVQGLFKAQTLIRCEDYASIDDLRRCTIKATIGPDSSALEPITVNIPFSAVCDPSVPQVAAKKGGKNAKTDGSVVLANVLNSLKTLISSQPTQSKIISVQQTAKNIQMAVSIRPTDISADDFKKRNNLNTYKNPENSIHNAVIVKVTPIVGIIAQISPSLQVHIQPEACGVEMVEKISSKGEKRQKIVQMDFQKVSSVLKVGDFITFRVLAPATINQSSTLIDGALLHAELNQAGVTSKKETTKASSLTTPPKSLPSLPPPVSTKPGVAYSIGDVINAAKVVQYNAKSSSYTLALPNGHVGELALSELLEPNSLIGLSSSTTNLCSLYDTNDIISQVIVLGARVVSGQTQYICSARVQRRNALLNGSTIKAAQSQKLLSELQSKYSKSTKITTSTKISPSTSMSEDEPTQIQVGSDGLVVDHLTMSTFAPGQFAVGIITNIAPQGIFVQLSAFHSGQITYSNLTDQYTDAKTIAKSGLFAVGQPIVVVVKDVKAETNQISLIAKPSVANLEDSCFINALQPGDIVAGVVKNVNPVGVFVNLKPSLRFTALSSKYNCVDDKKTDYQSYYKVGDKVKAVVLKVDPISKKIDIGLKASLFTQASKIKANNGLSLTETVRAAVFSAADESDDDDEDTSMVDEKISVGSSQHKQLKKAANDEQAILSSLFSPLATVNTIKKTINQKTISSTEDDEDLVDFSILDADVTATTTPLTTRLATTIGTKSTIGKDSAERKIELLEHALAGIGDNSLLSTISDVTQNTSTTTEFELRCAAQPNNAAVWIGYMAYQLENNDIQKAREICQRGLKLITISALDQRWMLYSSLLSIEVLYGTVTSLEAAIALSLKEFEKVKVYSEIGRVSIAAEKYQIAIDYYQKALRVSGLAQDVESNQLKSRSVLTQAQETYIALISLLFAQQKRTEAQSLLKSAIKQLPAQYTHLIIVKTILLEYQSTHGSIDNGRVMFQMFLKDHPKRVDVWVTWLQQEIKLVKKMHIALNNGDTKNTKNQQAFKQQKTRIRELFDIFTTKSTNVYSINWTTLKPPQMKLIYGLAIDFENSAVCQGDSRGDVIKNRAQLYVEEVSN